MNSYHQEVANVCQNVKAFFDKTFTSVTINGPQLDLLSINQTPLMVVSTHRSHVDYFLVGSIFHLMGVKNLRFAAGDNLTNLPWIGTKFKNFGAFAIERDTGFDRNYVRNLCNSVVSMIEKGDTVLVFPEGGRSYSGAMLEMRVGVFGASILSQANNPDIDVQYLPVAVTYENAPDIRWFEMQQKGKKLRKHSNSLPKRLWGNLLYYGADICSFLPFMLARFFNKKYGNVYVEYGAPVSVRSVVDVTKKIENARDDFSAHRDSMIKLGEIAHAQLSRLYRILPMHIVAAELNKKDRRSASDLADAFPDAIERLTLHKRNCAHLSGPTPLENAMVGIRQLCANNTIRFVNNVCIVKNPSLVRYYAATIGS